MTALESQVGDFPLPLAVVAKEYLDEPHPVLKLHPPLRRHRDACAVLSTLALAEVLADDKINVRTLLPGVSADLARTQPRSHQRPSRHRTFFRLVREWTLVVSWGRTGFDTSLPGP